MPTLLATIAQPNSTTACAGHNFDDNAVSTRSCHASVHVGRAGRLKGPATADHLLSQHVIADPS